MYSNIEERQNFKCFVYLESFSCNLYQINYIDFIFKQSYYTFKIHVHLIIKIIFLINNKFKINTEISKCFQNILVLTIN